MNLNVGNLSHQTVDRDLQKVFAAFRQVTSVTVIDEAGATHPEHQTYERNDDNVSGLQGW
jgi:hypothetical protein